MSNTVELSHELNDIFNTKVLFLIHFVPRNTFKSRVFVVTTLGLNLNLVTFLTSVRYVNTVQTQAFPQAHCGWHTLCQEIGPLSPGEAMM